MTSSLVISDVHFTKNVVSCCHLLVHKIHIQPLTSTISALPRETGPFLTFPLNIMPAKILESRNSESITSTFHAASTFLIYNPKGCEQDIEHIVVVPFPGNYRLFGCTMTVKLWVLLRREYERNDDIQAGSIVYATQTDTFHLHA